GYWGGGGGEGSCPSGPFFFGSSAGGGGGGSSFVSEEATSASFGLASPATAPMVSITYLTPSTATPDKDTLSFDATQPLETLSPPQTITITNEGGNPLVINAENFAASNPGVSSDHPEDFLIDSSSCQGPIGYQESCQLIVRFSPQAQGARTATLQVASNAAASPTVVTLMGTGGTLPQGPPGAPGLSGATGQKGPAGAAGKQGATAVYVCHRRKGRGKFVIACFVRILSAPHALTSATLTRGGVVYARTAPGAIAAGQQLVLKARRRVSAGRYTLILVSQSATTKQTITVG
ncbi:MAG: choice-of-anchor D domain-containing protein, partial [Solirubrobacterales bacterium]